MPNKFFIFFGKNLVKSKKSTNFASSKGEETFFDSFEGFLGHKNT